MTRERGERYLIPSTRSSPKPPGFDHVRTYISELFCTFFTCGIYVVRVVHIRFVCV